MKRPKTTTSIRKLRWGSIFFALLFPGLMVQALGQRGERAFTLKPSHVEAASNTDGVAWKVTGSFNTGRYLHTATLLSNGMVLVAGGLDNTFNATPSAELYDPASGTWTATGSLN